MSKSHYDIIADDQLADDNKGIPGYDTSEEVIARSLEQQRLSHQKFIDKLHRTEVQQ